MSEQLHHKKEVISSEWETWWKEDWWQSDQLNSLGWATLFIWAGRTSSIGGNDGFYGEL